MEPTKTTLLLLICILCCICSSVQNIAFKYNFNRKEDEDKIHCFFNAANSALFIMLSACSGLILTYNPN